MAKKQTRRTVSFNIDVYRAIAKAAAERGVSQAEYLTNLLRESGVEFPDTTHMHVEEVHRAIDAKAERILARRNADTWVRNG